MTTKTADYDFGTAKARTDVAATRVCLKCRTTFWSEGFGERICTKCKGTVAWRSAVSVGAGQTRRRSGSGSS